MVGPRGSRTEELPGDLDGKVSYRRAWGGYSACSGAPAFFDSVVDKAEDESDDEGIKVHESADLLLAPFGLSTHEHGEV